MPAGSDQRDDAPAGSQHPLQLGQHLLERAQHRQRHRRAHRRDRVVRHRQGLGSATHERATSGRRSHAQLPRRRIHPDPPLPTQQRPGRGGSACEIEHRPRGATQWLDQPRIRFRVLVGNRPCKQHLRDTGPLVVKARRIVPPPDILPDPPPRQVTRAGHQERHRIVHGHPQPGARARTGTEDHRPLVHQRQHRAHHRRHRQGPAQRSTAHHEQHGLGRPCPGTPRAELATRVPADLRRHAHRRSQRHNRLPVLEEGTDTQMALELFEQPHQRLTHATRPRTPSARSSGRLSKRRTGQATRSAPAALLAAGQMPGRRWASPTAAWSSGLRPSVAAWKSISISVPTPRRDAIEAFDSTVVASGEAI